jgi:plastocyanin
VLRRLSPVLFLVLATAACGAPDIEVSAVQPEEGSFFPQVVDFEGDVGAGISLDTDADGNPHMTYLALPEESEEAGPVDPLAPVLPAVMHAHLANNIWTRGPVAEDQGDLTADDSTAIAVDAEGTHHIAWTSGGSLFYTDDTSGEAEPQSVADVAAAPAIAAGDDGTPWIAYWELQTEAEGPTALLRLATLDGDEWIVETVAEGEPVDPTTIGLGVGPDGPIVAYGSAGETQVATQQGNRWVSETVDPESGGGVSMDLDADGNPHLAYLAPGGEVGHAHSIDGSDWEITDVGSGATGSATSIAVDDQGVHHIGWQSEETGGLAYASNADGQFVEEELPPATQGGSQPQLGAGPEGTVYVAYYDAEDTELQLLTRSDEPPLLAVPSPSSAPGGGGPAAACEPEGGELQISAQNLQFDTDCLAVEAAQPYSIDFQNQDAAPHNVAVYTDESAAEALLQGDIVDGGQSTTYEGDPIPEPGDLYFQCDIHPTMNGTFVVAEGGGGGAGGGGNGGGGEENS